MERVLFIRKMEKLKLDFGKIINLLEKYEYIWKIYKIFFFFLDFFNFFFFFQFLASKFYFLNTNFN